MRRFMMLFMVMLVMTAILAHPALAAALRPPVAGSGSVGTPSPRWCASRQLPPRRT
jgi:hypothetical protein